MSIQSSIASLSGLKPLFSDRGEVGGGRCGRNLIIAGPCSAESRMQVLETASALRKAGVRVFRAGIWKPRTHPGSFEGVGQKGLAWLEEVRDSMGMIPMTEVATMSHLSMALEKGIRAFWIGARTSANPFAVQELSDGLAALSQDCKDSITILVKNPVNPDLELWIGALQRIRGGGITRIGAIHRGFGMYAPSLYRNEPVWRIPIELNRRFPNLPVILDPSHIAGKRDLIPGLVRKASVLNYRGLMVEAHCHPDNALSDSAQQLTPAQLETVADGFKPTGSGIRAVSGDFLKIHREEIDRIDHEILSLLGRRMKTAREIGAIKQAAGISVMQPERYSALVDRCIREGEGYGLPPGFVKSIFSTIHEESVRCQLHVMETCCSKKDK